MSPTDERLPRSRCFAPHHKILIVEDEGLVAWNIEDVLRARGAAQVLLCASVATARQFIATHPDISLVLLDLKLRDGHAGELIDELLARQLPVIVTTGYSGFERSGVKVLFKPYSFDELLEASLAAIAH
jgi:DNA-binding NtrC family response regulator